MNANSEQLDLGGNVILDKDQALLHQSLSDPVIAGLGVGNCRFDKVLGRKVLVYVNRHGKNCLLLLKAVTYLGNPHPSYKKRIQLPDWYQDFCLRVAQDHLPYDVRFLGVYHYGGNVIFVDFRKDTYLQHGLHNSSAHVYINDLFQGQTYGIFEKEDKYGNVLTTIRCNLLKDYLDGAGNRETFPLFDLFGRFNSGFRFGEWIPALEAIREMQQAGWHQWKQAEWAGFYLEYRFDKFTKENGVIGQMRLVSRKKKGQPDFDIYFGESDFYGDLKASDIRHTEAPGNDQKNLLECIDRSGRFWYVIYEHETVKDRDCDFEATRARNQFIRSVDLGYTKDGLSYGNKMKNRVLFRKMTILELNRVNYSSVLRNFRQGHQPGGQARNPKFLIDKKTLQNDNIVVFRYTHRQQ